MIGARLTGKQTQIGAKKADQMALRGWRRSPGGGH
jgi:hypothetical protein